MVTTIALAVGRFQPITKNHERLFERLLETKADCHDIGVVKGNNTFGRNPFTTEERIGYLKALYHPQDLPFIQEVLNPVDALEKTYNLMKPYGDLKVILVGGIGDEGITVKSKSGASVESYIDIMKRLNGNKYKTGDKAGQYYFNFKEYEVIGVQRGEVSGSYVRDYIRENYPECDLMKIIEMLHSKFTLEDIINICNIIKFRPDAAILH